jgi:hypothetical protein
VDLEGLLGRTKEENQFALIGQEGKEMQRIVKKAVEVMTTT